MKKRAMGAFLLVVILLCGAMPVHAKGEVSGAVTSDPSLVGYYVLTNKTGDTMYLYLTRQRGNTVEWERQSPLAQEGDLFVANGHIMEERTEYGINRYWGGTIYRYEIGDAYEAERYVLSDNLTPLTEEEALLIYNGVDWRDVLGVEEVQTSAETSTSSGSGVSLFTPTKPSTIQVTSPCMNCGSDGRVRCSACNGKGGTATTSYSYGVQSGGWRECSICRGLGTKTCTRCGGTGKITQ
ncbi:MAG: hypothetical protein LBN04_08780 [Oscillospiraceae bacterium]|nr:hypothetical protein [Oscillospiraceae bacterium]